MGCLRCQILNRNYYCKDCLKKWHKLKQEDIDKILLRLYNTFVKTINLSKIYLDPNPKTYLNQEKWNDEIIKKPN